MHRLGKVLAAFAIVLSGCATDRYDSTGTPYLNPFAGSEHKVSYWDGDEVVGQSSIKIDLVYQRAFFYKGDQLAGVSVVSTGREGYDTPSGEFRITQKDIDHASNLDGDYVDSERARRDAEREYQNGSAAGRHNLPRGTDALLSQNPGRHKHARRLPARASGIIPAVFDCRSELAVRFFQNAAVGTPVEIIKS